GVVNHSTKPVSGVALSLEVDGQSIQSLKTDVAAGGSSSVTFAPFTVASRNMRGTVRLPDDALKRDNVFNFVVSPSEPGPAVVINRSGAESDALYLSRALAIGESPRVELVSRTPTTFSDADARAAAVVILDDVQVADDLADRLAHFVASGGGLLIALGSHATWPARRGEAGPAPPRAGVDRPTTPPPRPGGPRARHPP